MNNKGFTMIELLAIITVLITILLVSFPTLINMTRNDKEKQYNDMVTTLCKAGETYIYENQDEYSNIGTEGTITYVDVDELIDDNLINKNEINPKTGHNLFGNIKYITQADKSLKCDYAEDMPISRMLVENTDSGTTFLNTGINSEKIGELSIHNTIDIPNDYEQKDCSYLQDNSVICYWKETSAIDDFDFKYYDMHIAANGDIYTPYNSSYLFSFLGFVPVASLDEYRINLDFTGINTKYTVNMDSMFQNFSYNGLVLELSLGDKFYTKNVTNMSYMFYKTGQDFLKSLDLGDKFDTKNVTNMSYMFSFAGNNFLKNFNLGNKFDTSNVTNIKDMFFGFGGRLKILDLGDKFDTSNVTNMSNMFQYIGVSYTTNISDSFTLKLGRKFILKDNTQTKSMFSESAKYRETFSIVVGSEDIKNRILNLTDANIPQRVIDNNWITVE